MTQRLATHTATKRLATHTVTQRLATHTVTNLFNSLIILIFPALIADKEKKLTYVFIFTFLCGASEDFMKPFKVFIKPFEVPQRSVKINI